MTELKTLKDIDTNLGQYGELDAVYISDLKAEAVKWIKQLKMWNTQRDPTDDVVRWILDFFNLTEEDLK